MFSGGGLTLLLGLLVLSADLPPTISQDRPGYCQQLPVPDTDPSGGGSCKECSADAGCPKGKKCCGSSCGNTCQTPEMNRCRLPPVTGPCKALFRKYYYNWSKKKCEEFIYGGCHGNLNRFDSLEMCLRVCGGQGAP
ncbi:kunitz-type serine protease inhibitor 28-like [Zootoca vivipara]|uniref:kunitz-type serine protease inhibitor 28-like n=1 Tax=Zootoca vivipara TaxID=8524 RepID=UPI0015922CE1|nr:kunitz-type serine protease inhibitor 28-like [Zootoca vivipara]